VFCDSDDKKRWRLLLLGGFTQIYGPEGSQLAKPLAETEEGILYADLDFALLAIAKSAYDPAGHYSRPDVFSLTFNPAPNMAVTGVAPFGDSMSTVPIGEGTAARSSSPSGASRPSERGEQRAVLPVREQGHFLWAGPPWLSVAHDGTADRVGHALLACCVGVQRGGGGGGQQRFDPAVARVGAGVVAY
jgi:hypothetical protein